LRSRKDWEQRGGTVELEVGYDLGRGVVVSALVLALLAWNTPRLVNVFSAESPAQERISRGWQVFRDRVSKAVNSLRSPSPMLVESYGNNMFLGTGGALGDAVVFTVTPDKGRASGRLYWSARTYDTYLNGQWVSTIADRQEMGPGTDLIQYPSWDLRRDISFRFSSNITLLQTLFFPAEPLSISRTAQAIVSRAEDGSTDVNAIFMDPPLEGGEGYTILATVARPTVSAMRAAGMEYPDYILERYLQLPENFSPQIAELAQQVAGSRDNPYDQALAITQYLRRTITYTETVPEPPNNIDPIEWFLFDQRAGFCNYYASAEVLMLRSMGIPARMVVGYAEGTWNPELDQYVVIAKDSHAWPEVYFSDLGWVSFEPTVSQPLTEYPLGDLSASGDPGDMGLLEPPTEDLQQPDLGGPPDYLNMDYRDNAQGPGQSFTISPWMIAIGSILLVITILAVLEWRRRQVMSLSLPTWIEKALDERGFNTPDWLRWWSRYSMRTPMENLFSNVPLMLRIWGQKVDPSNTPAEQVVLLASTVPGVEGQARALLEEYHRAMYSQYPANLLRARKAVDEIRSVGLRNWALRLAGFEV
jgi:transglutaminase-like putative cysteine protease